MSGADDLVDYCRSRAGDAFRAAFTYREFQFLLSESGGVMVALDRDIGRNLHEFVLECERRLSPTEAD